jgi:hypothetical protein
MNVNKLKYFSFIFSSCGIILISLSAVKFSKAGLYNGTVRRKTYTDHHGDSTAVYCQKY